MVLPFKTRIQNPYSRPWKTQYLSYKNISNMCGNHTNGYKLYYKDSLIRTECQQYGYMNLENPFYINDSTMMFFKPTDSHGAVLSTKDGGYSWAETSVGMVYLYKFHLVNTNLSYCITKYSTQIYLTGIGKSDLSWYVGPYVKGRHYIQDMGTGITDLDSTMITMNDSLSYVILFK